MNKKTFLIKVINEKLFINQTQNISANELETVKLDCKVPNYERILNTAWSVNETRKLNYLEETETLRYYVENENRTLIMTKLKISDSGVYECFAETSSYYYITKHNLIVTPKHVIIDSKLKQIRVEKGNSVILDCTWWFTDAQNLLFDIDYKNVTEWYLNGSQIGSIIEKLTSKYEFTDSFNTLLKIKTMAMNEASDLYSCNFKLKNGSIKQSNFSINIGGIINLNNLID